MFPWTQQPISCASLLSTSLLKVFPSTCFRSASFPLFLSCPEGGCGRKFPTAFTGKVGILSGLQANLLWQKAKKKFWIFSLYGIQSVIQPHLQIMSLCKHRTWDTVRILVEGRAGILIQIMPSRLERKRRQRQHLERKRIQHLERKQRQHLERKRIQHLERKRRQHLERKWIQHLERKQILWSLQTSRSRSPSNSRGFENTTKRPKLNPVALPGIALSAFDTDANEAIYNHTYITSIT